jgi:transcription antitermination factor NusB
MQALFQLDVQGTDVLESLGRFFAEEEPDEQIRRLASDWTKGAWNNSKQCTRLSLVDKSILRLAVYQLKCCPDIPPKVAINEAIELAKKYSTDKSPAFVNGVLDAVLKKIAARDSQQ